MRHKPRPWHKIANKLIHILICTYLYISLHYLLPNESQRITVHNTYTHYPTQSLWHHVSRHIPPVTLCNFLVLFTSFYLFLFCFLLPFRIQRICFACLPKFLIFMPTQLSWQARCTCSVMYIYLDICMYSRKNCSNQRSAEALRERNGTKCKRQTQILYSCYMCVHMFIKFIPCKKLIAIFKIF